MGAGGSILLTRHVLGFSARSVAIHDTTASVDSHALRDALENVGFKTNGVELHVVLLHEDTSRSLTEATLDFGRQLPPEESFLGGSYVGVPRDRSLVLSARPSTGEYAYLVGDRLRLGFFAGESQEEFFMDSSSDSVSENLVKVARKLSSTVDYSGGRRGGYSWDVLGFALLVLTGTLWMVILRRKSSNQAALQRIQNNIGDAQRSYNALVAALDSYREDPAEYARLVAHVNAHRHNTDALATEASAVSLEGIRAYSPVTGQTVRDLLRRSLEVAEQGRSLAAQL